MSHTPDNHQADSIINEVMAMETFADGANTPLTQTLAKKPAAKPHGRFPAALYLVIILVLAGMACYTIYTRPDKVEVATKFVLAFNDQKPADMVPLMSVAYMGQIDQNNTMTEYKDLLDMRSDLEYTVDKVMTRDFKKADEERAEQAKSNKENNKEAGKDIEDNEPIANPTAEIVDKYTTESSDICTYIVNLKSGDEVKKTYLVSLVYEKNITSDWKVIQLIPLKPGVLDKLTDVQYKQEVGQLEEYFRNLMNPPDKEDSNTIKIQPQ